MKYTSVTEGEFVCRNNRFTAEVLIGGVQETVHVKNTGRMKELLFPGARVTLTYSVIQTEKQNMFNQCDIKHLWGG